MKQYMLKHSKPFEEFTVQSNWGYNLVNSIPAYYFTTCILGGGGARGAELCDSFNKSDIIASNH